MKKYSTFYIIIENTHKKLGVNLPATPARVEASTSKRTVGRDGDVDGGPQPEHHRLALHSPTTLMEANAQRLQPANKTSIIDHIGIFCKEKIAAYHSCVRRTRVYHDNLTRPTEGWESRLQAHVTKATVSNTLEV